MTCALIVYANGSEDMEVTAITDILNRGGIKVTKAALNDDGGLKVTLAHGTTVVCDKNLNDCADDYAVIAIPGGLVGAENCRDSTTLIAKLQEQKAKDGYIAAICAAPGFVLATHGLVGNARATGYPGCADNIENYVDKGVVVDKENKLITGQGPAFCMEVALAILEELKGKAVADEVRSGMLLTK